MIASFTSTITLLLFFQRLLLRFVCTGGKNDDEHKLSVSSFSLIPRLSHSWSFEDRACELLGKGPTYIKTTTTITTTTTTTTNIRDGPEPQRHREDDEDILDVWAADVGCAPSDDRIGRSLCGSIHHYDGEKYDRKNASFDVAKQRGRDVC